MRFGRRGAKSKTNTTHRAARVELDGIEQRQSALDVGFSPGVAADPSRVDAVAHSVVTRALASPVALLKSTSSPRSPASTSVACRSVDDLGLCEVLINERDVTF